MSSSFVNTLANSFVSARIGMRNYNDLIGPLDILKWGVPAKHKEGQNTDIFRVEYFKELFDHNTAGNPPTPIVSRRLGLDGNSGTPLVAENAFVERQLGMYANHMIITDATRKLSGDEIIEIHEKKLVSAAVADIGKLAFRTFDGLDGTSHVRFANAVSDEASVIAELAPADIRAAFSVFNDNNVAPITGTIEVDNQFNIKAIMPSFVLVVHPAVAIDVVENFGGTLEFVHVSQYAGRGFEAISSREIGIIPKYDCRVIKSPFVKAQTGVAGAATAGMRQSGGVNITYHNILLGAEAYAMPGLGRVVNAEVAMKNGTQKRFQKVKGVDFWKFSPQHSAADPQGIKWGLGYQFWCGDTAASEGGLLLPSRNAAGAEVYKAHKIITTASV